MKNLVKLLIGFLMIFGAVGNASASLIDDQVTAQHYYGTYTSTLGIATVTADSSDAMTPVFYDDVRKVDFTVYSVDVNADSFFVDFHMRGGWNEAAFNGVLVDGLDDSTSQGLQGVFVTTNMSGWESSRMTFDSNSVWLNWAGLYSFDENTYFRVDLDFATVPEPATMLLFGIGLLGLAGVNRKLIKS